MLSSAGSCYDNADVDEADGNSYILNLDSALALWTSLSLLQASFHFQSCKLQKS